MDDHERFATQWHGLLTFQLGSIVLVGAYASWRQIPSPCAGCFGRSGGVEGPSKHSVKTYMIGINLL